MWFLGEDLWITGLSVGKVRGLGAFHVSDRLWDYGSTRTNNGTQPRHGTLEGLYRPLNGIHPASSSHLLYAHLDSCNDAAAVLLSLRSNPC